MQYLNDINVIFGGISIFNHRTSIPFSNEVIAFLDELSKDIFKNCEKQFTDVISFAFYCRKGNLLKLKEIFTDKYSRLGRGLVFHIAPSNVPVNFAFSYIFSLLSGNISNVVRLPSKEFEQVNIIINSFINILKSGKHIEILQNAVFIKYSHNKEITDYFSAVCDARIIWGGDNTIKEIRKSEIPSRCVEIAFADRYSICVIDSKSLESSSSAELQTLVQNFYNDTYFIDQNACSSPHLIIWKKGANNLLETKEKFYKALADFAESRYTLQPVNAVDKLTKAYSLTLNTDCFINNKNKLLYRIELKDLLPEIENLREKCGFFFEYDCDDLDQINKIINSKYQTVTYYGNISGQIKNWIIDNKLSGIDRIVPVGKALDIELIWDGFNLASTLSRIIN